MFWKAEGDGVEVAEESLTGLLRSMIKCTAPGHLDVVREGRKKNEGWSKKKGKLVTIEVEEVWRGRK